MAKSEYQIGQVITIPAGTELNRGPSEDSTSFGDLLLPLRARVLSALVSGAIEITLLDYPDERPLYYHQREQR